MVSGKSELQYLTLRQNVVEIIRKKIFIGDYQPGDRVKELELANDLGISRGPIREAIRQLEEEGLLNYITNKGCFVTTLDPKDAWEIYLLRADLEILSLKSCKGDIGEELISKMENAYQNMVLASQNNDFNEMVTQDIIFHECICLASNNKHLLKLWSNMNGHLYSIFLTVKAANIRPIDEIATRHIHVLDAIKLKDLELASERISDHYLATGLELFNKHMKMLENA